MSERLVVLSPAYYWSVDEQERWAGRMRRSGERVGLDVVLYGLERQIDCHNTNAQSTDLIALMQERRERYVLVCDCVDVLFMAGEEEIVEKFKTFNVGMVVSGEKDCIPGILDACVELAKTPGYFTNLNIGLWMGEREYAIEALQTAMDLYRHKPEKDDCDPDSPQAWVARMIAWKTGPEVGLDRQCVLFQSMNLQGRRVDVVWDGEGGRRRVKNVATGTEPVAVHYNGDKSYVEYSEMAGRVLA